VDTISRTRKLAILEYYCLTSIAPTKAITTLKLTILESSVDSLVYSTTIRVRECSADYSCTLDVEFRVACKYSTLLTLDGYTFCDRFTWECILTLCN
jgi:hypothetical protein